jgi:putative ABC transport system permease protein
MSWLQRLRNTFRPGRVHRDIDREISFHIAERTDQLLSEGLREKEASRRARLQFGNVTGQAERTRDMDISLRIEAVLRNVRYAVRTLARAPGFTATVVLTLALGIGANTAVFSALDAVLLRPLPFPEADRLMRLSEIREQSNETTIAPARLEDWNRLTLTFEAITGYLTEDVSETSGDIPEKVRRATVAPRFLEVWGITPALGRGFTAAEHRFGGPPAILISDRYWRRRFGADPNVFGNSVRIESESLPIVGVMPASFLFPDREVDLWEPTLVDAPYAQHRLSTWFNGIGRLRPGVTLEQSRENLAAVQAQLAEQYPDTDAKIGVNLVPLKESTVGGIRSSLWLLFAAVSVLLLITCTNIAGLLLSRGAQRRQEISIRLSLGATRAAVAGQILAEAAVLAMAGAALGLLIAAAATAGIRSFGADLPRLDEISLDRRILLYTLVSAVTVAVLCGVLPAVRAARHGLSGTLGDSGRAQVSTRNSLQWLLVGAQVALSVTLLAGAGLLVRSFHELSRVNPGFDASRVLTFRVTGSWAETMDMKGLAQRLERTIEELEALPGVDAASMSTSLPGVPAASESMFELVEARGDAGRRMVAESRSVWPQYFATMQIPLLEGEPCPRQVPRTSRDVVVNEALASRYLSGWSSPVGLHLAADSGTSPGHRIIGIVGNARERGLDHAPAPTVYWCASWNPMPHFLVRTRGEPLSAAQAVRLKIKEIDPLRSVYNISPLEERIDDAFTEGRLRTVLLALFAATALSLACVGLYGTLSYVISLRRREIGLRLALGAVRGDIIRQFLMQGLRVAGVACVCGLLFSAAFTRALSGMLYGVSASDAITLSGVTAIVLVVAFLASIIPAMRAARLDPMRVLRDE